MKNILENLLGLIMIILVILAVLIFISMIILSLVECYNKNSNLLFIIIPIYIFFGWYFTRYIKHN